jgi:hypothetical protein
MVAELMKKFPAYGLCPPCMFKLSKVITSVVFLQPNFCINFSLPLFMTVRKVLYFAVWVVRRMPKTKLEFHPFSAVRDSFFCPQPEDLPYCGDNGPSYTGRKISASLSYVTVRGGREDEKGTGWGSNTPNALSLPLSPRTSTDGPTKWVL